MSKAPKKFVPRSEYPADWVSGSKGSLKEEMAKLGCFTESDIIEWDVFHNKRISKQFAPFSEEKVYDMYMIARRQFMVTKFYEAQRKLYNPEKDLWSDSKYGFRKYRDKHGREAYNPQRLIEQDVIRPYRLDDPDQDYVDIELITYPFSDGYRNAVEVFPDGYVHPLDNTYG